MPTRTTHRKRLLDKYTAGGALSDRPLLRHVRRWFDETAEQLRRYLSIKKRRQHAGGLSERLRWTQNEKPDPAFGGYSEQTARPTKAACTPIVLRWPGHIAPKRDGQTLISSIDLAPTILGAAGWNPMRRYTRAEPQLGPAALSSGTRFSRD